jgi:hypothetical protein
MHIIAYCYHWDNSTLWNLPRHERKMWVDKIIEQKKAENNEINKSGNSNPSYNESR